MSKSGFTLIEVLVTFILLAFVGMIAGYYYVEGIRGFSIARVSSDIVPKVSNAMERINIELRDCQDRSGGDIQVQGSKIVYTTSIPALNNVRTLEYNASKGSITLDVGDGVQHVLLDDLLECTMKAESANMDGVAGDEISAITVFLRMDLGNGSDTTYTVRVTPRNFVHLAP